MCACGVWWYWWHIAFRNRTSQEGDAHHSQPSWCKTTAPIRSRFYFQSAYFPLAKRPNHLFCSVPVIPLTSSRAGLSVSASLFSIATVTWCIVLSLAIGTKAQKGHFLLRSDVAPSVPFGINAWGSSLLVLWCNTWRFNYIILIYRVKYLIATATMTIPSLSVICQLMLGYFSTALAYSHLVLFCVHRLILRTSTYKLCGSAMWRCCQCRSESRYLVASRLGNRVHSCAGWWCMTMGHRCCCWHTLRDKAQ